MAAKDKIFKEQLMYQALQESYEEACSHICELEERHQVAEQELKYLQDYIHFRHLTEDYQFFHENAVPDPSEDLPFPRYTLLS